jgi:cation diffusion facilitator CzcD-associated flavoprotein CzcO
MPFWSRPKTASPAAPPPPHRAKVVVIGAGQAGLSTAYYLKRLGIEPPDDLVVLDRGPGPGGAWQHRWEALRLGSAHRVNDLPGMDDLGLSFETADRKRPAKDVVAEYYGRYEEHYELGIRRPVVVTHVFNRELDLVVATEGGQEYVADAVVNATGTWGAPFVPFYPGLPNFTGRVAHTAEYRSAEEFAGQDVVVVGGGTSAIGFMLELEHTAKSLTWVSRRPVDFLDEGELDIEARRQAVEQQDEAARTGRALPSIVSGTGVARTRRIQAGIERGVLGRRPMFRSVEADGVRFEDGSFQHADAILFATGFRPELRHLAPLRLREKAGGISVGNGSAYRDPRIFFAGYGPQASTIGANRAGRTIARQVVAQLSKF